MRRLILAFTLAGVSLLTWGVVAAPTQVHAVTFSPTFGVTPNPVMVGSSSTVSGQYFTPNNWAFVYWQRPDGTTNGVWEPTDMNGSFSFTLGYLPQHGTGTEWVIVYDNAMQTWTAWQPISVTNGAPPSSEHLSASPNPVTLPSPTEHFTAQTTVTGTGFTPNNFAWVQWIRPDNTTGGVWNSTDNTGSFSFTLAFDPAHGCGNETLQGYDNATQTWGPPYVIHVNCGA